MARIAKHRSHSSESDDEDDSRPQTPLSTAPNDRKRARRDVEESEPSEPEESSNDPAPTQNTISEKKLVIADGQISPTFQPGAIVRVKLTNFVTYTSVEFHPGPSLNMVIGPNGTGKSTLVCAICLGLGWAPSYLGRAKDAAEFVKYGCREATIEIELQRVPSGRPGATRKNPIITRTIQRDGNRSKFKLNGHDISSKAIQSLCQSQFDIQIDNLCQFLPQDKVVEFAQMTPIEILQSTQRAAGTPEMIQTHENLKNLRSAQKAMMHDNRGWREQLENLERRQEMQRTEVERMKERAVTKKKLEWLEQCQPVPRYGAAKVERDEAKQRQQTLNAELKKLEAELAPTLRKVNAKQAYMRRLQAVTKDMQRAATVVEKKCDAKETAIKNLNTNVLDLGINFETEKKSIGPKRNDKEQLEKKIGLLKQQYSEKPPEFDSRAMTQEIKDRKDEIRHLRDRREDAQARRTDLGEQGRNRQEDLKQLVKTLEGLETQAGQQESKLKVKSLETHKAWEWIQENRNLFEKHVYGPPMVECSLKNPKLASQIESMMQESDFKIITAQTEKDFALLQQKLIREKGYHDITLRTCSENDLSKYRRPMSDEDLRSNGLDSFVIDHLEGPGPVLAMLCNERYLHQSAITSRLVTDVQHEALSNSQLRNYVTAETVYQFTRRREYGEAGSLARARPIKVASVWTAQSVDMGRKASLERQLAERRGEIGMIKEEHEKCKAEIAEINTKIEKLNEEIKEITTDKENKQKKLVEWNALPIKIKEAEAKAQEIQEWLEGARDRLHATMKKKDEAMANVAEAAVQFQDLLVDLRGARQTVLEAEIHLIEATSDYETFRDRNQGVKDMLEQKGKEEKDARESAERANIRARQLVKEVQGLTNAAKKLESEGDSGFLDLLQSMSGSGGEDRWTSVRLDAEIDSQKAQLELTEGGNVNVIREFEDRAKAMEKLQGRLADFNKKQEDHKHAIKELREHWEPRLEALVTKINQAFADLFARIGCGGQVAVHKASSEDPADCTEENGGAENGLDFANWAIHISVKFREHEPLSLLDSRRQSGGERAVSTIFYLMALQSLSRAPFRVVDEINQGMDSRNERMVHERMVDAAADKGGSQYFLITPKLLSGLKYKRGMTILLIVSGENVPGEDATYADFGQNEVPAPKFDFRAFARKAQALVMGSADGGRRVDSGVGLGSSFGSVEVGA